MKESQRNCGNKTSKFDTQEQIAYITLAFAFNGNCIGQLFVHSRNGSLENHSLNGAKYARLISIANYIHWLVVAYAANGKTQPRTQNGM